MVDPSPDHPLVLSVLDQSPIPSGSTAAQALANSIDLARQTEAMGYHRYWVAEHHNSSGLAGAAPEIMIGAIAAATSTIRVGSGGVMLSHYAPFKVAETFRTLATLHPDRIDLGVGRAPGSDQVTMFALAPGRKPQPVADYPAALAELGGWLHNDLPKDNPFAGRVKALPASDCQAPELWVLASSPDSARFASDQGLPLSFADFITMGNGPEICRSYRENYVPSEHYPEPKVSIGAGAICAQTTAEAERLAASVKLWRGRGLAGPIPSLEEVGTSSISPLTVNPGRKKMVVGDPATVRNELSELADDYGADEVIVVTIVWDHSARVESYRLIAEAFGLTG